MKIRLEIPAVNISNLTYGKNEIARLGDLHEKVRLDLYFLQGIINGNQNKWICHISTRGFLIEILLHIYNLQQAKYSLVFYSLLIFTIYENIYSKFLVFHSAYSNFFFNDDDVTTLKTIHPIMFRIIKSNQLKCGEIKITLWKHATFLYNGSRHSIWMFVYGMYFIT